VIDKVCTIILDYGENLKIHLEIENELNSSGSSHIIPFCDRLVLLA